MGNFKVKATFYNPRTHKRISEDMLVDTGATFSGLPAPVLRELGIEPEAKVEAILADGRKQERDYAILVLVLDGKRGLVPVSFQPVGATPVLGSTALELLGFSIDPVEGRLIPRPPIVR